MEGEPGYEANVYIIQVNGKKITKGDFTKRTRDRTRIYSIPRDAPGD